MASNFNPTVPAINTVEGFAFLSARTSLQTLSTRTLATHSGAKTVAAHSVSVTGKGAGLYVFNVNASFFQDSNNAFTVSLDAAGQTVVVNITNAPASFSIPKGIVVNLGGTQVGQTTPRGVPVLFNITSSAPLTINPSGQFNGTLLAPYATFTGNASMDGQLLVATLNNAGEIHDQ